MNCRPPISNCKSRRAWVGSAIGHGFTLVEMMITVGLLGFIVVGLVGMFVQTQRAFRVGTTQTDVLEAGRAAIDVITREMEEATPASLSNVVNFRIYFNSSTPVALSGTNAAPTTRANVLQDVFFSVNYNQKWFGLGYVVADATNSSNPDDVNRLRVGSLYHYQSVPRFGQVNPANLSGDYNTNIIPALSGVVSTNLSRICDGVVHFRLQAYTINGLLITNNIGSNIRVFVQTPTNTLFNPTAERDYDFYSNAVPAYLELELGLLERGALEKFNALPFPANSNYLARAQTAGRIHIFRRRIPVHNVDPAAYR